ncbi:helix-turn-helix domain-containing protein [Pedobacter foliorum]|uniref:helix-turn-helix domain-containing protein n=1 Tax=Pedobacter foliorum TaxID=2739058 RepID=UPI001563918D|nr:helix-turn-helix transcriptional regulator [Pedobacter foliorum]NRF40236.1 helix-turn-helix transcriptional regulator [Pedobacter foliorum]
METSEKTNKMHLGRKISRIRELRGMKQEALATELGISQQAISKLEQSEEIEDSTLEKIAVVLGVSSEAIKGYSDEAVFNIISNTFHNTSSDNSTLIASSLNYQPTFNTVEKIVELYERLLQSEREKVELLKGTNNEK